MAVPHAVLASGWIPFVVVIVVSFIFASFPSQQRWMYGPSLIKNMAFI